MAFATRLESREVSDKNLKDVMEELAEMLDSKNSSPNSNLMRSLETVLEREGGRDSIRALVSNILK